MTSMIYLWEEFKIDGLLTTILSMRLCRCLGLGSTNMIFLHGDLFISNETVRHVVRVNRCV